MKKMERVLNAINKSKNLSLWIGLIDKVHLVRDLENDYCEVKLYVRFNLNENEEIELYETDINIIVSAINRFLIPHLQVNYIAEIKEVKYLYNEVEIILICQDII